MSEKIPYRQIHLDFHTSEKIDGIAAKFDAEEWVGTLKKAKVNSINVFGKCHHGMFYYPTKLGTMHPGLHGFNLLGEQARVLKRENIRFTVYTCIKWSEDTADKHPEWLEVGSTGSWGHHDPLASNMCRWQHLCLNKPEYIKLIKEELKEQYELFHANGCWIDIVWQHSCFCKDCMRDMLAQGVDPQNELQRLIFHKKTEINFMKEIYVFLKGLSPDYEVYFNANPYTTDMADIPELSSVEKRKYFDFIDIESLPSDCWGYSHFPIAANYMNKYDQEITMMNGKFHTSWGDFSSMRNLAALEYECFRAAANGAKICIGDQMHPSGVLDSAAYERIGKVYSSIEEKEPWLKETKKISDVAVLLPTKIFGNGELEISVEGAYRVLSETKIPFDIVNLIDDISKYKLLILPDGNVLSDEFTAKINAFVKNGGKLLVTGRSAVKDGKFVIDSIPAEYVGQSEHIMRYIHFESEDFTALPQTDHVLYERGETVKAKKDAKVLARIKPPYFNRSYHSFCSHRQTPAVVDVSDEPAVIASNDVIYVANPLFADYAKNGYTVHKDILVACIKRLLGRFIVETNLPNLSEITLREHEKGMIVHTLSYAITRRCKIMDTIDDVIELYNKNYAVYTGFKPSAVTVLIENKDLPFEYEDGYVKFIVSYQKGHSMILIGK